MEEKEQIDDVKEFLSNMVDEVDEHTDKEALIHYYSVVLVNYFKPWKETTF